MVGTFADVVVSDAIVKGIEGFDYELARMALKKDAFETPPPNAGSAVGMLSVCLILIYIRFFLKYVIINAL